MTKVNEARLSLQGAAKNNQLNQITLEESKTPKALASNASEVDLGTSSFFRVLGTAQSPSNTSITLNSNNLFRNSVASMITTQQNQ